MIGEEEAKLSTSGMLPVRQVKIEVAGISYTDAQELAKLLEQIEGIESTRVPWKTVDHAFSPKPLGPLELQAAAEAQTIMIVVGISALYGHKFLGGVAEEAGKDTYAVIKKLILRKFGEWRASRSHEQRERIFLVFDDEHMLVNKGETES